MNAKDLTALKQGAIAAFRELNMGVRLEGNPKPLTQEDQRLIAIYQSALQLLNSKGAIRDGWLDANPVQFLEDDSDPKENDYT